MSELNPETALENLMAAREDAELKAANEVQLREYAGRVLSERGALVFATRVMYGGTAGLIGSAETGVLLSGATEPILVGDTCIALRHQMKGPGDIELLRVAGQHAKDVQQSKADSVIATMGLPVRVTGLERPTQEHLEHLHTLIKAIESVVEPLPEMPRRTLPTLTYEFEGFEPGRVYNLREHPEEFLAPQRIKTNFARPDTEPLPSLIEDLPGTPPLII